MSDLPDFLRRTFLVLVAALLAACGPGGGGTGTGPIAGQFFTAGTSLATPIAGAGASTRVDLQLQPGSVELTTDCGRFVFAGEWASAATVVLPGRYETAAGSQPATLRLQFGDGGAAGSQVVVSLTDAAGAVLLSPVPVLRTQDLPPRAAGACS